jgi:hypothetical protein
MALTKVLTHADTDYALLQIRYVGDDSTHTAAIDNDGSSSELLITLTDDGGSHTVVGNTTTTLQGVVDAINAFTDADGLKTWEARRRHGSADYDTGTDDFIDQAATAVGRDWEDFLFRDASEVFTSSLRISHPDEPTNYSNNPTAHNQNSKSQPTGQIRLIKVRGSATFGSGTMTLRVSRDAGTAASAEVLIHEQAQTTTAVDQTFIDNTDTRDGGYEYEGPILVELIGSAAQTAGGTELVVEYEVVG